MIIIWGTRFYGKVDKVPGLCYVTTRFGHLWFIPLIPVETYLILDMPGESGQRGLRIPMSGKSVLAGWLRAACFLTMVISGIITAVGLLEYLSTGHGGARILESAPWLAVSTGLFGLTYLFGKPSRRRAVQLGAHLGVSAEVMLGLLMPRDRRLKEMEADQGDDPDAVADSGRDRGDDGELEWQESRRRDD
jgi:hypothetical protein